MTKNMRCIALCAAFVVALTSQTALAKKVKLPDLPDKLGKDGLVIMQVGPHHKWHNAEVRIKKSKKGNAHDGFFVRKLKPGKYTLESVKRISGFSSTITHNVTHFAIMPINREFEIHAGKVTHLGLQYLLEDPKNDKSDEAGEFIAMAFENTGSEHAFLTEYYPELAANVTADDVVTDPHDYVNDKLPMARRILIQLSIAEVLQRRKNGIESDGLRNRAAVDISESNYVVGDLGLVARVGSDKNLEYLESHTVDRIAQIRFSGKNPWFYSRTGNLYKLNGSELVRVDNKPADFLVTGGAMLNDDGLVLSDRRFHFLVSQDQGASWTESDTVGLANKQFVYSKFSAGSDSVFAIANDRAYLMKKTAVAKIDRNSGQVSEMKLPKKLAKHVAKIFETQAGMFALTNQFGEKSLLYHKATGSDEWVKNEIVNYNGCKVSFANDTGKDIFAHCGPTRKELALVSGDYGKSWYRRQAASTTDN